MNAIDTAFTDIADAIRSKNGETTKYKPSEMPNAILNISGGLDVESNAGAHNSIYRGKSLGTSVSADQFKAISDGTFDDMFIGDYWEMGNNEWRIAAFDYYFGYYGNNVYISDHHVLIVPDRIMGSNRMEATNITTNGYNGSEMKTTTLPTYKTTIEGLFGAPHIMIRKDYFTTASVKGYPSNSSFAQADVDLMNEHMVYGNIIMGKHNPRLDDSNAWQITQNYTESHSQLPLFRLNPSKIIAKNTAGTSRTGYWLQDVVSAAYFAIVRDRGGAGTGSANASSGVRPCFGIVGLDS